MKLLVTGGLGFIGSNFILKTLEDYNDMEITNVDAEVEGSNHENLSSLKNSKKYRFVKGDITDHGLMEKLISQSDMIVNFAAESHVDRSISNAKPFMHSNIDGVFTLLEILRKYKKRLVHISTDEVFGSLESGSADENYRFNPSSPYSASKGAAELLINSYFITYGLDVLITRCTNNYGPRQDPEKLIPKTILLAYNNIKIPIYGTGKNIRDWIFVDDHSDAILKVLMSGKSGQSYNISANNELNNLTIIKKILSFMDKSEDRIEFVSERPGHDYRYSLDSKKIQKELGWVTSHDFNSHLQKTIEWYLENKNWWSKININELSNIHSKTWNRKL